MFKAIIVHIPSLSKNKDGELESSINYCATGLFSLASEIQKEKFSVEIIHLGIEKYLNKNFILSDYIKENKINFVAFSMHWHEQAYDVIEVAREVKNKNPKVHISLGGLTASYYAQEILKEYIFVDSIIKGEGEIAIKKLARALSKNVENFENIPNLCYLKNGKFISNENPTPLSFEEFDRLQFFNPDIMKHFREYLRIPFIINYSKENLFNGDNFFPISLGRGCLGNCAWCGGGYNASIKLSGRREVVYRNTKSIIDEIKILNEKYGVKNYAFSFDPKGKNREEIIYLFNKIRDSFQNKINTYYNLDGLPDETFLKVFKETFGSNSTLALSPVFQNEELRKKYKSFYYSNNGLESILKKMDDIKINSDLYFSIIPGISEEENDKSREYGNFLKNKYKYIKNILIYPVHLEPGAALFEEPKKYNILTKKKTFKNYYKETRSIEKSYENKDLFI